MARAETNHRTIKDIPIGIDATGKRQREWHSGYRTKREAEDARIRLLSSLQVPSVMGRWTTMTPSHCTEKYSQSLSVPLVDAMRLTMACPLIFNGVVKTSDVKDATSVRPDASR